MWGKILLKLTNSDDSTLATVIAAAWGLIPDIDV